MVIIGSGSLFKKGPKRRPLLGGTGLLMSWLTKVFQFNSLFSFGFKIYPGGLKLSLVEVGDT